jgi:hypothetical protein
LPVGPYERSGAEWLFGILRMKNRSDTLLTRLVALAMLLTWVATPGGGKAAADDPAYVVEVADVTAKVGEPAVLHATLRPRDGYRVLKTYNNRVIELSSFDDGVTFDRRVVQATIRDDGLDFAIGLRATKPGRHPINGYFRVGYIAADEFAMVSLRLIANVNGTE